MQCAHGLNQNAFDPVITDDTQKLFTCNRVQRHVPKTFQISILILFWEMVLENRTRGSFQNKSPPFCNDLLHLLKLILHCVGKYRDFMNA